MHFATSYVQLKHVLLDLARDRPKLIALRTTTLLKPCPLVIFALTMLLGISLGAKAAVGQTIIPVAEVASPKLILRQNRSDWTDFALAADETAAATSSSTSRVTEIYDLRSQRTIASIPVIGKIALSRDGRSLLVGTEATSGRGDLLVWTNGGPPGGVALPIDLPVNAVALTQNARVAAAGADGIICVFDTGTARELWRTEVKGRIWTLAFSGDGSRLLVTHGFGSTESPHARVGGSKVLETGSGKIIAELDGDDGYAVIEGYLSLDGTVAATVRDMVGGISIWETNTGRTRQRLLPDRSIGWFALSPDGERVAAQDDFGVLRLVRIRDNRILWEKDTSTDFPGAVEKILFSDDGTRVITVSKGAGPVTLAASDGTRLKSFGDPPPEPLPVARVQISSDGTTVLARSRAAINVWSLEMGQPLLRQGAFEHHRDVETQPVFNPYGADGLLDTTKVCEPQTAVLSPRGDRVAFNSCYDKNIVITSPEGAKSGLISIENTGGASSSARLHSFSKDGAFLAIDTVQFYREPGTLKDRKIRIYDVRSFKLAHPPVNIGVRDVWTSGFSLDSKRFWAFTIPSPMDIDPASVLKPEFVLIDVATGTVLKREYLSCGQNDCVNFTRRGLQASPRANWLSYYDGDFRLRLKQVSSGTEIILSWIGSNLATIQPAFSCDERKVVYGDGDWNLVLRDLADGKVRTLFNAREILPNSGRNFFARFSCFDNSVYLSNKQQLFKLSPSDSYGMPISIGTSYGGIVDYAESGDGMLALATPFGVDLVQKGSAIGFASLSTLSDGDYLVISPDGRFDSEKLERLGAFSWLMADDVMRALAPEIFMRDYFEPRLISRLLTCRRQVAAGAFSACDSAFTPVRSLASLNRVRPTVRIVNVERGAAADEVLVDITVESAEDKSQPNHKYRSDAYDLRLFRDGQLVGQSPVGVAGGGSIEAWRSAAHIAPGADGKTAVRRFAVRLPVADKARPVTFSAYAFNEDRVKSETTPPIAYPVPIDAPSRRRRAYVVSIGINGYDAQKWRLSYAASDAKAMGDALAGLKDYEVIRIDLISSGKGPSLATKANIRAVLERLAGQPLATDLGAVQDANALEPARPDDLVILSFSGHGHTDRDGAFYLLPADAGADLERDRDSFISSEELSQWLRPVDAGQMVLIIDACHSAASVAQPGFKPGPMGDRGLGQLAYDKAMRILAATQVKDVAIESGTLRQGLLTYALVRDGLGEGHPADLDTDGAVTLAEWLRYAETRVPEVYEDIKAGRLRATKDPENVLGAADEVRKPQTPALFDFAREHAVIVIAGGP